MAQVQLRIAARRRWFFWPAFGVIVALAWLGIILDFYGPADWLTTHGIVWDVG